MQFTRNTALKCQFLLWFWAPAGSPSGTKKWCKKGAKNDTSKHKIDSKRENVQKCASMKRFVFHFLSGRMINLYVATLLTPLGMYIYIYGSFSLCIHPSFSSFVSFSFSQSFSVSICLYTYRYTHNMSVYLSVCLFFVLSIHLPLACRFLSLSLTLFFFLVCVCIYIYICVCVFVSLSLYHSLTLLFVFLSFFSVSFSLSLCSLLVSLSLCVSQPPSPFLSM